MSLSCDPVLAAVAAAALAVVEVEFDVVSALLSGEVGERISDESSLEEEAIIS